MSIFAHWIERHGKSDLSVEPDGLGANVDRCKTKWRRAEILVMRAALARPEERGGLRLPLCEPDDEIGAEIMAEVRRQTIDLAVAV